MSAPLPARYRVISTLGQGGMATVYLAEDTTAQAQVAVKVPHRHFATSSLVVSRLRREVAACRRVRHQNVVTVHDLIDTPECLAIVLEYVPGGDLRSWFLDRGALPAEEVTAIARQVLAGLSAAHEHGVVHRDLKPHNLLRAEDGTIKISDFGIARVDEMVALTQQSMLLGSPAYMPPEAFLGQSLDARGDLYSLGVTLYELLTGELPVRANTAAALVAAHHEQAVPDPRAIAPAVPEALALVVMRALAKDPEQRYASAAEMLAALGGQAVLALDPRACPSCGASGLPGVATCVECGHAPIRALERGKGRHRVIVRGGRLTPAQKAAAVAAILDLGGELRVERGALERRLSDPQVVVARGLAEADAERLALRLREAGVPAVATTARGIGRALTRSPKALSPLAWAGVALSSVLGLPLGVMLQHWFYVLVLCGPAGVTGWACQELIVRSAWPALATLVPFLVPPLLTALTMFAATSARQLRAIAAFSSAPAESPPPLLERARACFGALGSPRTKRLLRSALQRGFALRQELQSDRGGLALAKLDALLAGACDEADRVAALEADVASVDPRLLTEQLQVLDARLVGAGAIEAGELIDQKTKLLGQLEQLGEWQAELAERSGRLLAVRTKLDQARTALLPLRAGEAHADALARTATCLPAPKDLALVSTAPGDTPP